MAWSMPDVGGVVDFVKGALTPGKGPLGQVTNNNILTNPRGSWLAPWPIRDFSSASASPSQQQQSSSSGVPTVAGASSNDPMTFMGAAGPTTDTLYSPLAVQMYMANGIAPALNQTAQNLQNWNQSFGNMAQNNVMNKYLPPQFQAYFQNVDQQQQNQNANIIGSLQGAAAAGPALDQMMNQINNTLQAQKQAYANTQYEIAQGGGPNPYGTSSGPPTSKGTSNNQLSPDGKYRWDDSKQQWNPA